jgi:hypothetical protein
VCGRLTEAGRRGPMVPPHLIEDGQRVRTEQGLPGHGGAATAVVRTPVLNRGGRGVRSPLDDLEGGRFSQRWDTRIGCERMRFVRST